MNHFIFKGSLTETHNTGLFVQNKRSCRTQNLRLFTCFVICTTVNLIRKGYLLFLYYTCVYIAFMLCPCPPGWDRDSSPGRSSDPGLLLAWAQQLTLLVPGEEPLGLCCDLSQHRLQDVAMVGLCKALQGISLTLGTLGWWISIISLYWPLLLRCKIIRAWVGQEPVISLPAWALHVSGPALSTATDWIQIHMTSFIHVGTFVLQ